MMRDDIGAARGGFGRILRIDRCGGTSGGDGSGRLARTRPLRRARVTPLAAIAIASVTVAADRRLRRWIAQNPRPVEFDVGIVLFEETNCFFVDGRAPDAYTGRRAEPVQQPLPRAAAPPARVGQRGGFVAALVAIEAELRQGLLPFLLGRRFWPRFAFGRLRRG
jgi:hypothetical protein